MTTAGRVDTHHHVVPPAYAAWLRKKGIEAGGLPIADWSLDGRRRACGGLSSRSEAEALLSGRGARILRDGARPDSSVVAGRPRKALIGLATVFAGVPVYVLIRRLAGRATTPMSVSRTSIFVVLIFLQFAWPVSRADTSRLEGALAARGLIGSAIDAARGPGKFDRAVARYSLASSAPTRWIQCA